MLNIFNFNTSRNRLRNRTIFIIELILVILVWRAIWGLADLYLTPQRLEIGYLLSLLIFIIYVVSRNREIGY